MMMLRILLLSVALITEAGAQQIDYFFKFTDEAAAKADPTVQQHMDAARVLWNSSYVLRDVKAWRPSQDTTSGVDAFGNPIVVHTFLPGFFLLVSSPRPIPALLNHSALQFALNRDGPPWVVRNNIGAIMQDVGVSPVPMGSRYPIGGIQ